MIEKGTLARAEIDQVGSEPGPDAATNNADSREMRVGQGGFGMDALKLSHKSVCYRMWVGEPSD